MLSGAGRRTASARAGGVEAARDWMNQAEEAETGPGEERLLEGAECDD